MKFTKIEEVNTKMTSYFQIRRFNVMIWVSWAKLTELYGITDIAFIATMITKRVPETLKFALMITQKQPPKAVLRKRYSEIMQQINRRTPMPKCDFNKLCWNHTLAWVLSCKFAAYFQNIFSKEQL